MAQEQHTPGPWFANKNTAGYYDIGLSAEDYAPCFAAVHHNPYIKNGGLIDANARLIAAAPDMLAVLKTLSGVDLHHDVLAAVDAAIAKAEGRS